MLLQYSILFMPYPVGPPNSPPFMELSLKSFVGQALMDWTTTGWQCPEASGETFFRNGCITFLAFPRENISGCQVGNGTYAGFGLGKRTGRMGPIGAPPNWTKPWILSGTFTDIGNISPGSLQTSVLGKFKRCGSPSASAAGVRGRFTLVVF